MRNAAKRSQQLVCLNCGKVLYYTRATDNKTLTTYIKGGNITLFHYWCVFVVMKIVKYISRFFSQAHGKDDDEEQTMVEIKCSFSTNAPSHLKIYLIFFICFYI